MADINLSEIHFGDGDPVDELIVQFFVNQIRKGKELEAPVLMRRKDNTYEVLDGYKRLEAKRRCGQETTDAYVIEEVSQERLLELRKKINQHMTSMN